MKESVLLWLDDLRDPSEEMWRNHIAKNIANPLRYNIVWVKDYNEFTSYIKNNDMPYLVSFDHDLADEHYTPERFWNNYEESKKYQESQNYSEKTGLDCARFLIEYCQDNHNGELPNYYVHSYNPVGADNIRALLTNFIKFKNNN